MFQNYRLQKKCLINFNIKITLLILLPLYSIGQNNNLSIKKEPCVSISLDSARLIDYNEDTSPLEVVTRNILGIVEVNPAYYMEQTEFVESAAHAMELTYDSTSLIYDRPNSDTITDDFQILLYLQGEFKDNYLFSDSLKFNYRWIRAGQEQEAVIMVNNEKIYFLRRILGLWKIYVWTNIDFFDSRTYERFDDN